MRSEQIITESGTTVGFYDASDTLEPLRNAQIGDGDLIAKASAWDSVRSSADDLAAAANKRAKTQKKISARNTEKLRAAQKASESPILSTVKAAIAHHAPKTPSGRVAAVTIPLSVGAGVIASGRSPREINQQVRTKLSAGKEQAQEKYAESRDTRRYRPASLYYDDMLKSMEEGDNVVDVLAKGLGDVLRGGKWADRVIRTHPIAPPPRPARTVARGPGVHPDVHQAEAHAHNLSGTEMRDAAGKPLYVDNARKTRPHPNTPDLEQEFIPQGRRSMIADELGAPANIGPALTTAGAVGGAGVAAVKGAKAILRGRAESKAIAAAEKAAAEAKAKRGRQVNRALTTAGIALPTAVAAKFVSDRYAKSDDSISDAELQEIAKIAMPGALRNKLIGRASKQAQKFSQKAIDNPAKATKYSNKAQSAANRAARRAGAAGATPAATGAGGMPGANTTRLTGIGDIVADIQRTSRNARAISEDVAGMTGLRKKPGLSTGQKVALGGAGAGGLLIGRNLAGPKPYPYQQQQA